MPLRQPPTTKISQAVTFGRQKVTNLHAGLALYWPSVTSDDAKVKQKRAEVTSDDAEFEQKRAEVTSDDAEVKQKRAEATSDDAEVTSDDAEVASESR